MLAGKFGERTFVPNFKNVEAKARIGPVSLMKQPEVSETNHFPA
jgi:hypothetical protein